jgi:K+-sensing histidine kinase KdpD
MRSAPLAPRWTGYPAAILAVSALTATLKLLSSHVNSTTVALALLLAVLFIAARWGSMPALLASLLAMLYFNYFFLPPFQTLTIAAADNWIALTAFLLTAVTAGQLSARARRRAEEAESGRRQIQQLYSELKDAFERASQAEALKQSEKLKSALLDAVSHDLRTPLTSIKASITTLLDEVKDPEKPVMLDTDARLEMMEVIDEECDRLNRFIGGLIDLARIDAGEMKLRRRWVAMDEIISAALLRAEPLTRRHNIHVSIENELPVVRADDRAISEVVYTLIDNAAKFSPRGSNIEIKAQRVDDALVRVAVEDEGPGIPAELRERVFDKFFRATRDGDISTQEPPGTGLGLSIAKGIVEAHAGSIWVEGRADRKGTCVVFTLPLSDEVRVDHLTPKEFDFLT